MAFVQQESFNAFKKYIDLDLPLELLIPYGYFHLDLLLTCLLFLSRVLTSLLDL